MTNGLAINILAIILLIWSLPWKVYALWTAVKNNHKKWFVAIVILNTAGILEIFYLFKIAKKNWAEVKSAFNETLSSSLN